MGDICKTKAEWKYWHKIPVTNQKFFKIMLGDFEYQIRIPRKFVKNFREALSRWCTLSGPSGNEWKVRVKIGEDDLLFSSGWEIFVKDNGIEAYDMLVFQYMGGSTFTVSVFNKNGCEREGSYFAKVNSSRSCCSSILHRVEDDSNVAMQKGESMNDGEHSAAFLRGKRKIKAQRSHYNAIYRGKWKVGSRVPNFALSDNDDDDDDDNGRGYREEEEEEEELEESFSCNANFFKPRKQVQKCYISGRRQVTEKEKERACVRAEEHIKRNKANGMPMVGIIMLPTHVYKGLYLTIPKEWAMDNMLRKNHDVELQVSGAEDYWLVGVRWIQTTQCQLRPKWADFVLDNNLEEGDVCVFELVTRGSIKAKRRPVFNVRIFRVVADVVPLTSKRMA
ncbi:B3 domain-containing protein LOC_Os12g40090-like [Silene latifolia]|uniref:B3 domain-containing protein LOC_Os12g40090-like n=1 Tax=Silene latifolia TaxID=37657 RepID=UPI003D772E15